MVFSGDKRNKFSTNETDKNKILKLSVTLYIKIIRVRITLPEKKTTVNFRKYETNENIRELFICDCMSRTVLSIKIKNNRSY